jgi:predicted alpha-1,2-mannosidase
VAPKAGRGGRNDVEPYMQLGYVPSSRGRSASETVEYGQDDFALGQLAGALGHSDDAQKLAARSGGWSKLFDAKSGFLWAKDDKGAWASDHSDPTKFQDDFVEANAWQTVFGPLWDIDGLVAAFGGKEPFVAALESFFEQGKADYESIKWNQPLSAGALRKYYWGGNEPDMHAPYLFALAGRRDLMEKWVRWIMSEVYGPGADGLPGNDDGGTMSAWYAWSAIGLYPIAGSDRYIVGVPAFPHVEIAVNGGTFTIDAPGVSDTKFAVQSVKLDGAPLTTPTLRHADLKAGGKLEFVIGG